MTFEFARLSGTKATGIVLQTRQGNDVENEQAPAPDERAVRLFTHLRELHPQWELRKEPCGIYNCFGHVWAARRTAIYEQSGVETILRDDGYRKLSPAETPLRGDIAVYYDMAGESLWHAGVVCEFRNPLIAPTGEPTGDPVPWVLSKLNDVTGEVLHRSRDVHHYESDFVLEFFTDRPI